MPSLAAIFTGKRADVPIIQRAHNGQVSDDRFYAWLFSTRDDVKI